MGRSSVEQVDLGPLALRFLALMLGLFFLAMGLNKIGWLIDSGLLGERFARWLPNAAPYARWYLENVAIPGVPLFARLVPLGELCAAAALILGIRVRVAAVVTLAMVFNFHFATSAFSWEFLRDGTGPPVLGGLMALAIAGRQLPFCVTWPAAAQGTIGYSAVKAAS
jgi:uncharacterized membrane protein YphA (DoxX/SURF4 family)